MVDDILVATIFPPKIYLLLDLDKYAENGSENSLNERLAHNNYLKDLNLVFADREKPRKCYGCKQRECNYYGKANRDDGLNKSDKTESNKLIWQ